MWHRYQIPIEKLVAASREISGFLKAFVSETDPDFGRVWRSKTYIQRFLSVPPDMGLEQAMLTSATGAAANSSGNVVMYPDVHRAVEELVFRGVEVDIIVFEMLTWAVFDIFIGKPLVSALITYLLWRLLVVVREHFGQKNTAKKTLIDDKFLF